MRQLFAAIAILALAASVSLAGCAEEETTSEAPTYTMIIESQDGTAFEVEVTDEFGTRTPEEVLAYVANITINQMDENATPSVDPNGVYTTVAPATPMVGKIATDGGFIVKFEQVDRTDKLDGWIWDFQDVSHAQGHCPPGH